MIYKTDYHIHSRYSDGRSAPEDYIVTGIAAGLSEMGFSDHLSLNDNLDEWNMDKADILLYISHIANLRNSEKNIKIKTGLEVDFFSGKENEIRTYLRDLPLDYIIGSVHYLGEKSVDGSTELYEEKNINKIFESYFNSVSAAASSGLFDIIGHCDLVRIFGYKPTTDQEPLYRILAKAMKKHNIAFEVNTNGRNRPLADFYPDRKFLHVFNEENVPVCVNSDAHMPSRVGQYFDEAYELLRYVGFTEMAVFDKRERHMVPF